ncbi:response regulator transcription factor [Halalkalibacter flavus]|uniref:response regulator transcription factor n=1 Tax=Halalkalibacter flavus TaxID=3090668 RepID=UPI002FC5F749
MYKVVLIDDEKLIVESLKNTVPWETFNCRVVATGNNGKQAVELYEKHEPDLVITDIKMPVMSGIAFLEAIAPKRKADKVIVLSGFDEFAFARDALKYKAYHYLLKPIDRDELYQVIEKAIKEIEKEKKVNVSTDKQKIFDLLVQKNTSLPHPLEQLYLQFGVMVIQLDNFHLVEDHLVDIHTDQKLRYVYHPSKGQVVIAFALTGNLVVEMETFATKIQNEVENVAIFIGTITDRLETIHLSYEFAMKLEAISPYVDKKVITKTDYEAYQELTNDSAEVLKQAKAYIENNYQKEVTHESVAKQFGFSPSYFSTLFKKHHGITFIDHVTNVRIKHACRLLKDTKKPTYAIANLVGYEDQRYFSQVFKRKVGQTPSAYRKKESS